MTFSIAVVVRRIYEEGLQEAFDESHHEVGELFEVGTTIVADVAFRARARGSDSEIAQREAHTWTFEGEKINRSEWGRDLEKAFAEAGRST